MKTVFRWVIDQWPAWLCLLFLGTVLYLTRDDLGDIFLYFGVPLAMAVIYIANLALSRSRDDGEDDLLTRLRIFWLRRTMQRKRKAPPSKRQDQR